MRDSLDHLRALLAARAAAFNLLVPDFTARCGPGRIPAEDTAKRSSCGAEFAALSARSDSIVRERERFDVRVTAAVAAVEQRCAAPIAQLQSDRAALVRQQRVNEASAAELEAWASANAEAQQGALALGVTSIFGSAAKQLESRQSSATALKGVLTRYERQVSSGKVPLAAMQARLDRAGRAYASARAMAVTGSAMSRAGEANDLWKHAQTEAGVVTQLQAEADADVKAALSDPAFQRFVQTDATALDLVRSTLDQVAGAPPLERFAPHYSLASFIVDYGYESTKWGLSRARILQGSALSDLELRAVDALVAQMERTVARLRACRTAP